FDVGGSTSKLRPYGVSRITDMIRGHVSLRDGAEVTLEANPEDVSPAAVRAWKAAGINRVSLGVQSFDAAVLSWMHRTHDADSAYRAIQVLREGGLSNISVDLIFAVPESFSRSWKRD